MHFLYRILLSVFVLAAVGQGAPKGKDTPKAEDTPKSEDDPEQRIRPTPEYLCAHVYEGFYSRYYLLGTGWPTHEIQLIDSARKAKGCHLTNWRYQERVDPSTNGVDFNCTFDMPVLCQKKTQKALNNELGFAPAKKGGIFCPEITETDALKKLFKDIGARRPSCGIAGATECEPGKERASGGGGHRRKLLL